MPVIRSLVLSVIAFASLCRLPAFAQDHAADAHTRSEAIVQALATGQADAFEAAAQANFSATALARRTPQQRAEFVSRIVSTFGHVAVGEISETADGVRVSIHGDAATSAVITFTFDNTPEQRIAGLSIDLNSEPPPPQEVSPSHRSYTTTDAMVRAGDHVLSTRLYAPAGRTAFPVVVLMPGSGNESLIDVAYTRILAQAFAARGVGCLAYDKAGNGRSTGTMSGSDFEALGADGATLARYARSLPQVERVGLWGSSQAGWEMSYTLRRAGPVSFAIMVSPGGVTPFEQVAYFLHLQALGWGLSPAQVEDADRMHRAVALYYAGRASYHSAQAEVDSHREEPWFHRVITNPYWDEMTPEGRILTPGQLAAAIRARPDQFELYRSASTFRSYRRDYESLRLPTLVIYGSGDQLVPVTLSKPMFESALAHDRRHIHEFRVFEGADHDIRTPDGAVAPEYLALITAWARARFDEAR